MPQPKVIWTDELREEVKRLYRSGLTATEVAAQIGPDITKNMVLGQLFHMGAMRSGKGSKGVGTRAPRSAKSTSDSAEPYEKVRLPPVNEVWGLDENERRRRFATKAARAAREQLMALMAEGV